MERVYVANLPPDIRIKDIDDFFRPFGKLVYIDVNHRANPVYAYVQFDSARNAFNAVKSRHGYDYEGYTLQLRLVENEVRNRRDATPPPPPPPMFSIYDRQNDGGFNNNFGSNINRNRMGGNFSNSPLQSNSNSQWSNNRSGMQQQNMPQYPTTNRLNISQQNMSYSSGGRSNIQQQYPNINRSNIQQEYSNSNIQPQYSNRSDMLQQNMVNYSNTNRSNMPQQQNMHMIDYPNNSSWNNGNNSMGWNSENYGIDRNNYNDSGSNQIYNSNTDPYARPGFEDSYTRGLSGSGRKWFNRYIRKGFSPEIARNKALEHRTVPYLREDPINNKIPSDPTNMALETIGNTIISFLSTTPIDNYNNNNWGGNNFQAGISSNTESGNFERPGPSSSTRGRMSTQAPRNAVSKQQYSKSLDILKNLRGKREQSAKDRISKKYHTQIVRDYEKFEKISGRPVSNSALRSVRNDEKIILSSSEAQLLDDLRKIKKRLLMSAKRLGSESNKRFGGAYKKRMKILMNEACFSELEAKALAVHPLEKLKDLISIKKEYDMAITKTDFIPANKKVLSNTPKVVVYRNDIKYLSLYEKQRLSNLSPRIKDALRACISRIHKYEKERKLPLTHSKFTTLLLQKTTSTQKKQKDNKEDSKSKKTVVAVISTDKKEEEKKDVKITSAVDEKPRENEDNLDNQEVIDITDEDTGGNEEQFDEGENPENEDENDDIEDQNEEE